MKADQSAVGTRRRGTFVQWLRLGLISLLASLPITGFVRPAGTSSMPGFGAQGQSGPTAIGTIFTVNTTGDAALGGGIGQQCSLRAAINAANTQAGDDGIVFSIPLTDPGCDASTGRCVINLGTRLAQTGDRPATEKISPR